MTIVTGTVEMAAASHALTNTPEHLAWFDALTDEDIAAQLASDPETAWELEHEPWIGIVPNPNYRPAPPRRPDLLAACEAAFAAAPRHLEPAAPGETAEVLVRYGTDIEHAAIPFPHAAE